MTLEQRLLEIQKSNKHLLDGMVKRWNGSWKWGEKREINNDLDFLHKQLMEWRYLHIPELKNINSLQGD